MAGNVEDIKVNSRGLRGTLAEGLEHALTGQVATPDQTLIKFHGIYQQDNRDRRAVREEKKLEWDYSFMIRLRIAGGQITAQQWLGIEDVCDRLSGNGVVKITTRQTVQLHGVWKSRLKPTVQAFDALGLDAIAACGDVNRNVIAGVFPALAPYHEEVHTYAQAISDHLLPTTGAFREIWLDGEKLTPDKEEAPDPLYGTRYLPRKFKIAIAIPPHNETDVFVHDIGLIAIGEGATFHGFNVVVGGGMGTTHGNAATYPRLGTVLGFIPKEKTLDTVWHIAAVQRDFGNREERKLSRLKYTLDRMGVAAFQAELESRLGFTLEPARPYAFTHRGDMYGWQQDAHGKHAFTVYVEHGLVRDDGTHRVKSGLKAIVREIGCGLRFTANQNVLLYPIAAADKPRVEALLNEYGLSAPPVSKRMQDALACVAMPTCPLALAEGQRYLPTLIPKIDALLATHGLSATPIHIRMTGCPNGCARPYVAEIGLVGKAAGRYALRLGGDANGVRLNRLYKEEVDEAALLAELDTLFAAYKANALPHEGFGDFTHRTLEYVP